jgi:hypothetical protein
LKFDIFKTMFGFFNGRNMTFLEKATSTFST